MIEIKITDYDNRNGRNESIASNMISYFMKNEGKTAFAEISIDTLPAIFDNSNTSYAVVVKLPEPKKERVSGVLGRLENVQIIDNN